MPLPVTAIFISLVVYVLAVSQELPSAACGDFSSATGNFPLFPPDYSQDFMAFDGHLKPFGSQRKPEAKIKEYYDVLTPQEMHANHVRSKIPLVFRGAVAKSPAIPSWTDDFLNTTYGDLDVLVELKKENRTFTTGRMRFGRFLELYKEKRLYVVSLLPKQMMKDVQAVNSVLCGTFRHYTHESNLWMSDGGTRSVIHYDADENIHCLLAGRKDFMAVEKKYERSLYFLDIDETAGSSFSDINPDCVDLEKYPDVVEVPWTYATLHPGDCIYLPSQYIHQVRSYGRSIAVTTLFTNGLSTLIGKDLDYDTKGCEHFDANGFHTMDEIDFHWTYGKGNETIDMGYMNVEIIRLYLLRAAKAFKSLNFERFREFYMSYNYGEGTLDAKAVFDVFLTDGRKELTVADIRALTRIQLKFLGRCLDPPHGPQAEDGKEVFFMPGDMNDEKDDKEVEKSSEQRRVFMEEIEKVETSVYGAQASGDDAQAYEKVLRDEDKMKQMEKPERNVREEL